MQSHSFSCAGKKRPENVAPLSILGPAQTHPANKLCVLVPLQIERERQEEAELAGRVLEEREAARTGLKAAEKELRALVEQRKAAQAR